MQKDIILTSEGFRRLEEELSRLTLTRQEVRDRVRDTKPTSDEGEDAAYDSARTEQAFLEGRIQELREVITRARILSAEEIRTDEVQLGSAVRVTNLSTGREIHFRNVTSPVPDFVETYVDDGYTDMKKVMRTLVETDFRGILIADHVPQTVGDSRSGWAYSIGYIRALYDTARDERT